MKKLKLIEEVAEQILKENPFPVVRFRLLRKVLKAPSDADLLIRLGRRC